MLNFLHKTNFVLLLIVTTPLIVVGQPIELDQKLKQAQDLFYSDKLSEAEYMMIRVLAENQTYALGWEMLANIRYRLYEESKLTSYSISNNFRIIDQDKNRNNLKNPDSTRVNEMKSFLISNGPAEIAYAKLMYTLRKATLVTRDAVNSSNYVRALNIDAKIDSNIDKRAFVYYDAAIKEFENRNYRETIRLTKHAIEHEPAFYKAAILLGRSYLLSGNDSDAIASFSTEKKKFPNMLDPRKYLVDAYGDAGQFSNAIEEAKLATTIYPDLALLKKLDHWIAANNQVLNISWTPRAVFPNSIANPSDEHLTRYYDNELYSKVKRPWTYYKDALQTIEPYCDRNGIIVKPNSFTHAKYMEVFCWEEMLKNSENELLKEAKRMQQLNFLDCYVMITCFH